MSSLRPDYDRFGKVCTSLLDLHHRAGGLDIEFQKLIAENLMLRLFYELERVIEPIALKLVTGAPYLDMSIPTLLIPRFASQDAARKHMLAALSTKKRTAYYLEWTMLAKVKGNLNGILDPADHFLAMRGLHDATYEEMRHVRNHIAHSSTSTRAKFSPIAKRIFGTTRGISPAKLLLSQKIAIPGYGGKDATVVQYIKWSRTFVKTLTKSPV